MRTPRKVTAPLPIMAGQVLELHRPSFALKLVGPLLILAAMVILVVGIGR